MADPEHENILGQGVKAWNVWRSENPGIVPDLTNSILSGKRLVDINFEGTDLRGADIVNVDFSLGNLVNAILSDLIFQGAILRQTRLQGAELSHADLSRAVLDNTNFSKAVLVGANISETVASDLVFQRTDLTGANLRSSNLRNCNFTAADLSGADVCSADFSGSNLVGVNFDGTIVDADTRGLENLSERELAGMIIRDEDGSESETGKTNANPTELTQASPSGAAQITVGAARPIIEGVHAVLDALPIPNDWGEAGQAHADLFTALLSTIEGLNQGFAELTDENRRLSEENEELRSKLDNAKPILRKAWETFVIDAAKVASKGPTFIAGFIAGMGAQAVHCAITGQPITIEV